MTAEPEPYDFGEVYTKAIIELGGTELLERFQKEIADEMSKYELVPCRYCGTKTYDTHDLLCESCARAVYARFVTLEP